MNTFHGMDLCQSLWALILMDSVLSCHFYELEFIISDSQNLEEQEREKRRQIIEKFQKAPFEEIAAQCESKVRSSNGLFNISALFIAFLL